MQDLNQTNETRICFACAAELKELDKYCRNCGAEQVTVTGERTTSNELRLVQQAQESSPISPVTPSGRVQSHTLESTETLEHHDTQPVSYKTGDAYRRVSGPLVDTVTAQSATRVSGRLHNEAVRHVLSALLAIPIWLIIVVLSPVDAYLAAKEIAGKGRVGS
jgi:hypothetical protein